MSQRNPNRPAPLIIFNEHARGKRFGFAWLPQQSEKFESGESREVLVFVREHTSEVQSLNMRTGRIGKARQVYEPDQVRVVGTGYFEAFQARQVKTIRVMTAEQAAAADAAYGVMTAKCAEAREEYQIKIAAIWKAARNLRQSEIDPELMNADDD